MLFLIDGSFYSNFLISVGTYECHHSFQNLLNVVDPAITKKDAKFRKAISPAERLCLFTVHYLAYGDSQQSLFFSYRFGRSTILSIINETCAASCGALKDEFVRFLRTPEAWKVIAKDFQEIWNLPHCLGAIDGKMLL